MMKKITEVINLDVDDIRDFCVEHGYYTKGNNSEYQNMLAIAHNCCYNGMNISKQHLFRISRDIYEHSSADLFYGCNDNEAIANIMFLLSKKINHFYTIEE